MKSRSLLFVFVAFSISLQAQNFSDAFFFTLPPFDSTTQQFLPHFRAEAIKDFISTSPEGSFVSGEKIVRFWGVNLTTGACFPQYTDAPGVAARMRKMGINLVRFHHMDNPWTTSEGSIFYQNGSTTTLNTTTLDRLHYFLSQMKQQGIYANINLHVSRTFTESDGILYADSIPEFGKGVTLFDGELIELQKQYARQLLSTINPYTGLALAEDPVMAMLEITNENTLYGFWKDNRLQAFSKGGGILSRHADTLDLKWNEFLQQKYETQENLESAWQNDNATPPAELVIDGGFEVEDISQNWILELHQNTQADFSSSTDNPAEENRCARVNVTQVTTTNWHIQFEQNGLSLEKDSVYSIRFFAKSDAPSQIYINIMRNADPWNWYGGSEFQLESQWREYHFSFKAPESNSGTTRLSFILGDQTGTFWFDEVSLTLAQKTGLETGENLADQNIRRMRYSERLFFHPKRTADMAAFYLKLQKDYYDEMYDYLKNELGVSVPITGSNALGGSFEPYTQSTLDYIDDHAYWDHPRFPNQPWSSWDWYIRNESMLKETYLGTIPDLFGGLQVQGKPFTVSEYNHPQPNIYQVEMLPLLAAYGSFHGVDGFMFFEYNGGGQPNWENDLQNNFFGLHRNTPVMALFPLFSYAYQNELIQEDPSPVLVNYTEDYMHNMPQQDNMYRWGTYFPYDNKIALESSVRIAGFDFDQALIPDRQVGDPPFVSSTDEIVFMPDLQLLSIRTALFECMAGKLENAVGLPGNQLHILEAAQHAVIAWLSLTEDSLSQSKRSIIAISSRIQNQNMFWDGEVTVHNNWGFSPTEVQALKIDLLLDIEADSIRIYPLDPVGKETNGFSVLPQAENEFFVSLDQNELQSLWFGIEVFKSGTGLSDASVDPPVSFFPNPIEAGERIRFEGLNKETRYKIVNLQDRVLQQGKCHTEILMKKELPPGLYFISFEELGRVEKIIVL